MLVRPAQALPLLGVVACMGCGRIGVENLPPEPAADAMVSERDAAQELEPSDASDAMDADANDDAGEAEALDAAQPDAASGDCWLSRAGGGMASYRTGDLGVLEGSHMFALVQGGLCAASAGCALSLGSDAVQASCSVSPCQMWESVDAGAGWYSLRNAKNGACLYMSSTANSTRAISWECFDSDRVRWQIACAGNDTWHLISKLSSKMLAGEGASAPNAGIVQTMTDSAQSRWRITSNAKAYDVIVPGAESDASAGWRYTTANPGASWAQSSFDDGGWSTGAGAFGDMTRGYTPVRTTWTGGDIWLRRSFTLSNIPDNLVLRIFHDEDAEVFINGMQVTMLTGWSHGYQSIDVPAAVRSALVAGPNTLAVHCRNNSAPQIIDASLISYTWR